MYLPCHLHFRIRLIRLENDEMPENFVNDLYRWALECKCTGTFNKFGRKIINTCDFIAVAVVGLNTRLGCLEPHLSSESEAQKMIDAANTSFTTLYDLEFSLPFWKYFTTPTSRKLFEAQDVITEYRKLLPSFFPKRPLLYLRVSPVCLKFQYDCQVH